MNYTLKKLSNLDSRDFIALLRVFEEAFEMEDFIVPDEKYLQSILSKSDFMVFVISSASQIIGGLTAYHLHSYYEQSSEIYIYDLAIKPEYQRKGYGKILIDYLKKYCKTNGIEEIFVQADLEDAHAIDFYHTTGGKAADVIHFSYPIV
jgi:ribosomal protein S18 acetylase RimI-like enzyme